MKSFYILEFIIITIKLQYYVRITTTYMKNVNDFEKTNTTKPE